MERHVPVETTVHQRLLICDYCGQSEDDVDEEMITYEKPGHPDLHLHEGCVEEGLGNFGPRPETGDEDLPFLWKVYSIPPTLIALESASSQDRSQPTNVDVAVGWIVWLLIQFLVLMFMAGAV